MRRVILFFMLATGSLGGYAQSSLPPCPTDLVPYYWTDCTGRWGDQIFGLYEGEWRDGRSHGWGTRIYGDGGKYVGEWQKEKRHGKGALIYTNGEKHVGEFRDNSPIGPGIHYNADGTIQKSGWWAKKKSRLIR